jgi:hypothetical protein
MGLDADARHGLAARRGARRVRRLDAAAARLRHAQAARRALLCDRLRRARLPAGAAHRQRRSFRRSTTSRPNGRAPARCGS